MAVRKTSKGSALLLSERPIYRKIVIFAFPLFLSNLFQQLYNAADSLIVGNLIGSDALASVSSSGNLIFLLVGFFSGIAMGAGVVIAHAFDRCRQLGITDNLDPGFDQLFDLLSVSRLAAWDRQENR